PSVFAADFDNDGDSDLVTANYYGASISILLNNGDGTFVAAVNYSAGDGAWSVFAADLDSDGDNDLAVADYNSNNVSVLLSNVNNPIPTIISISPDTKIVGDSEFTMIISGTGFNSNSIVRLNGSDRVTTLSEGHVPDGTELTAVILTSDMTSAGIFDITVFNPAPGGGTTTALSFTVIDTFTLTYIAGTNGTLIGTTPQTVYDGADGSAVTAVPDNGYHFIHWSDASTTNPRIDTNVNGDITVTAYFERNNEDSAGGDGGGSILNFYRPTIISNGGGLEADISINENETFVTTIEAKASIGILEYSIYSGDDKALFIIDHETGELNFKNPPDYESPRDKDRRNIYELVVRVDNKSYAASLFHMQKIHVSVLDVEEVAEDVKREEEAKPCVPYLEEYIKFKSLDNEPDTVQKLKKFLNKYEGEHLDANNTVYNQASFEAVIRFQEKYKYEILTPWGLTQGTGHVYKTTIMKINAIVCPKKPACELYLTEFIKFGSPDNNPEAVKKLKKFLNQYEGESLDISNTEYDKEAYEAVIRFQEKYADEILTPWGISKGTGWVYTTTLKKINTSKA
ncbi:MAG: FG-GAP-like repeat-containing protein, partial [Patescibacteria group bacterium]